MGPLQARHLLIFQCHAGDPPNVVIGNKLKLDFNEFLENNGILVLIIMPLATYINYLRFRHKGVFRSTKVRSRAVVAIIGSNILFPKLFDWPYDALGNGLPEAEEG